MSEWRRLGAIDKAANVVRHCLDLSPRNLVEIGAGDGAVLQRLSDLSFCKRMYAIEVTSSSALLIARREIPQLECSILYDGGEMPFQDRSLDLAILSHVLEHAEYPRKVVQEAARIASHVYVEVPLEYTLKLPSKFTPTSVGHINFFSRKTIRLLLESSGLEILTAGTTNPSRRVYSYAKGNRGQLNFWIKEVALRSAPVIAPGIFVYHYSLLCRPKAAVQC